MSTKTIVCAVRIDEAKDLQSAVEAIGEAYGVHVTYLMANTPDDGHDDLYLRSTYPLEWVGRYILRRYVRVDPVVREGFLRTLPFDWREVAATDDAMELMLDAQAHGLHPMGYCWPLVDKQNRRGLLSVNGRQDEAAWDTFVRENCDDLYGLANAIHQRAVQEVYGDEGDVPMLSSRELECLFWTAQGKSATDIAGILEISPHTVRVYLKNVRTKFGVASLRSAVLQAQKLRMLQPPE